MQEPADMENAGNIQKRECRNQLLGKMQEPAGRENARTS
jgi:hypothetical protein